jgi:glycosyltransferase involved in cell wall biosynthesis
VEYLGEIGEHEKAEFLGNALALMFLINWQEPFGLVLTEAMASALPSSPIAWVQSRRSSTMELHIAFERYAETVGINVLRRSGDVEILASK